MLTSQGPVVDFGGHLAKCFGRAVIVTPFARYSRRIRFRFSLAPRCQSECAAGDLVERQPGGGDSDVLASHCSAAVGCQRPRDRGSTLPVAASAASPRVSASGLDSRISSRTNREIRSTILTIDRRQTRLADILVHEHRDQTLRPLNSPQ